MRDLSCLLSEAAGNLFQGAASPLAAGEGGSKQHAQPARKQTIAGWPLCLPPAAETKTRLCDQGQGFALASPSDSMETSHSSTLRAQV